MTWYTCRSQSPRDHQPDGAGVAEYLSGVGGPQTVLPDHRPLLHRGQGHQY